MQGSVEVKSDVGLVSKGVDRFARFDVDELTVGVNDYANGFIRVGMYYINFKLISLNRGKVSQNRDQQIK